MTTTNTQPAAPLRFASLNGLRAISILFVIVHHLYVRGGLFKDESDHRLLQGIMSFFFDGQLGVNIFFIISGFLITSLLLEETRQSQTVSLRNFYIRRTLRIFPAYYFFLLVLLSLQLLHVIAISSASWLTAVTYTKYFNWPLDWITAHGWSLSIEEQFYLFWPLLFLGGEAVRKWSAAILVIAVPCFKLYLHYHPVEWITELSFFTRIDSIAMGCLIALYREELLKLLRPRFQLLFFMAIAGIFVVKTLKFINVKFNLHQEPLLALVGTSYGIIANILIGIIILYSVFVNHTRWFRLLNSKVLYFIGLLSYSIYLWQQVFIGGLAGHWVSMFPQNILFVAVAALFSYYVIEKPMLKMKERFHVQ